MTLLKIEHTPYAYFADFLLYGCAICALGLVVGLILPDGRMLDALLVVAAAVFGWTIIEYAMHRFLLHHVPPFSDWHAEHHRRPLALISTPTVVSASLIVVLVYLPARLLGPAWLACAVTLGVLIGYLAYGLAHHASHHWRPRGRWMLRRKQIHGLHHRHSVQPVHFGVTTTLWDNLARTTLRQQPPAKPPLPAGTWPVCPPALMVERDLARIAGLARRPATQDSSGG